MTLDGALTNALKDGLISDIEYAKFKNILSKPDVLLAHCICKGGAGAGDHDTDSCSCDSGAGARK